MSIRRLVAGIVAACAISAQTRAEDNLVPNGSFDRSAEGWHNQMAGGVADVDSQWLATCGREGTGGVHIRSASQNPQGIWIWRCIIPAEQLLAGAKPDGNAVKFGGAAKGKGVKGLVAICLQAWNKDSTQMAGFGTTQMGSPLTGDFDWTPIEAGIKLPKEAGPLHLLIFLQGTGEAWFDDIHLTPVDADEIKDLPGAAGDQGGSTPGLFEARGEYKLTSTQVQDVQLLLPIPLSHGVQAPLTYSVTTDPPGRLVEARVFEDKPGNWVADVTIHMRGAEDAVRLTWSSLVLVGPRGFEAVPEAGKALLPDQWPEEVRPWLASTRCVQAAHDRIKAVAAEIRGDLTDVMEIIDATLKRTTEIYAKQSGFCTDLDAVQALDRQGSCTSCANLVAALLRANNIPARILSGYPVWSGPLQTHYIVEAWVPGYGWYPIESTLLRAPWPQDRQINVSIIPPEYEDKSLGRPCGAAGVPYLSLTESPKMKMGGTYTIWGMAGDPSRNCDHVAKQVRAIDGAAADWKAVLEAARKAWLTWLKAQPTLDETGAIGTSLKAEGLGEPDLAKLQRQLLSPTGP